jgi:hypothetical protein
MEQLEQFQQLQHIMTRSKQSALQRIQRIMKFNYNRGLNSERVNEIYRKIINLKLKKDANTTT